MKYVTNIFHFVSSKRGLYLMKSEEINQFMQQKYPPPCSLNLIVMRAAVHNRLIKGSPTCHEIFVNIIDCVFGHPVLPQSLL